MLKTRVIPCLLLKNRGLVKTVRFENPRYVGDPLNAVRIFNTKEVDELVFLDILASRVEKQIPLEVVSTIARECSMPFAVGGGIRNTANIKEILKTGAEKVVINTAAVENPTLIREAASIFGSQSIMVSLDAKQQSDGSYQVFTYGGTRATGQDPVSLAKRMEELGAGEILLTSIDRDGTMTGYDLELTLKVADAVTIPVIACGGAGRVEDLAMVVKEGHAAAVAAGSLFVFHGRRRAVLISFPTHEELTQVGLA